jgi:hypothetical protein
MTWEFKLLAEEQSAFLEHRFGCWICLHLFLSFCLVSSFKLCMLEYSAITVASIPRHKCFVTLRNLISKCYRQLPGASTSDGTSNNDAKRPNTPPTRDLSTQ